MKVSVRRIAFLNGVVLCGFSVSILIPLLFDIFYYEGTSVHSFFPAFVVSFFLGVCSVFAFKTKENSIITKQDGFLVVIFSWMVISIFGAFPFYFYRAIPLDFISSFFESASGITVTGLSVYPDVEILPRSLMLWRFILHLIGGVGIVAIGIVLFPKLRIGGMQLFYNENSDKSRKIFPRVSQLSAFFITTYALVIFVVTVLLMCCGMEGFDAICHAISSVSTGGFSTKNLGIAHFDSRAVEIVLIFGMLIGGLNFFEIIKSFKLGIFNMWKDSQIKCYTILLVSMSFLAIIISVAANRTTISHKDIVHNIFNVVSFSSTTNFFLDEEISPVPFLRAIMFVLAMIGGCSGSTTGGIKIFRIQLLWVTMANHMKLTLHPLDVAFSTYQGQKINNELISSILSFVSLLLFCFLISVFFITISEKNCLIGCGSIYSCIFNIGSPIDYFCDEKFHIMDLTSFSKIIMIINMIVGRLEIIPFFVILSKYFWR